MNIVLPPREVRIHSEADVVVVGGGPAGIGAAVSSARNGAKVILIEKRGFMGGNITAGYVETCNHFLRGGNYNAEGLYAEIEEKYRNDFGSSGDIRPNAPHRFSSEFFKIFLDRFVTGEGVTVFLHSFVNEVLMDGGRISCVIIQSKQGPVAIKARVVIDCSGDGDVAFAAGVPFEIGRESDNRCQPGTLNFRITGADSKMLTRDGKDRLTEIGKKFRDDYRAGITGLRCKRQDIPWGRLTKAGQISYINYPCAYGIDPTNFEDLTRGEMECRDYIPEICDYMREHFDGFSSIELVSIAPEIGFRDSRRIRGEYRLTSEDVTSGRHFNDAIARFPQFYDMLSPDANMNEGSVEDAGNNGYICVRGGGSFEIPYRCLLPVGISNLLVAGRCISADHVAESGIRAILACMYTGQAAGTAAALSDTPKEVNVKSLRENLSKQNIKL